MNITQGQAQHLKKVESSQEGLLAVARKQRFEIWVGMLQQKVEKTQVELVGGVTSCRSTIPTIKHVSLFIYKLFHVNMEKVS